MLEARRERGSDMDWSPQIGRVLLASFAPWQGYNAIELFRCDTVQWTGARPYCSGYTGTGIGSGAVQGTLILIAVVAVLLWLWVWPFVRQAGTKKRSAILDDV